MSTESAATYLDIEWTNQHGCGDGDLNCQIILQYMCQEHKDSDIGSSSIINRKRNGKNRIFSIEWVRTYEPHRVGTNVQSEPWPIRMPCISLARKPEPAHRSNRHDNSEVL